MTRTAGAQIGCQRPSRFWGLGCPKIYHEAEDTLVSQPPVVLERSQFRIATVCPLELIIRTVIDMPHTGVVIEPR
ncbi:hypothetical protein, partial [Thiolapillus sp.]|uniref:hypothetical protein n=1 Tax=Thiolapillus sp. TaxID=2017437 RepID=UPI0025ED892A